MKTKGIKRFFRFGTIFLICITICIIITYNYIQNKSKLECTQMEQLASTKANKVNYVITNLLYKTEVLSALVIQSNGEIEDFEKIATTIIDDPAIRNVVIAPNGIVTHVYPKAGNEALIGFDYFGKSAGNQEALLAKETGELVLGGPFELVQGGEALVGRLPVYLNEENGERTFWGLVSVTLNYPQALEGAELDQLKNQGFAYEIWRINPDNGERQIIANSNYKYNKNASYVEEHMKILNAEWYFRLSPLNNWYQYPETWIFLFAGTVISILIASLVRHNYDLKKIKTELEELTYRDALTGTLNRRGLFKEAEDLILAKKKFTLCFIDLNKFKIVNDTYGHNIGDILLQEFAYTVQKLTDKKHTVFSRIGGDEFILIFEKESEKEEDTFFKKLEKELQHIRLIEGREDIDISFSIGKAAYPEDGENMDQLIRCADNKMYQEKEKTRS